jgi:hypothetical protein
MAAPAVPPLAALPEPGNRISAALVIGLVALMSGGLLLATTMWSDSGSYAFGIRSAPVNGGAAARFITVEDAGAGSRNSHAPMSSVRETSTDDQSGPARRETRRSALYVTSDLREALVVMATGARHRGRFRFSCPCPMDRVAHRVDRVDSDDRIATALFGTGSDGVIVRQDGQRVR